MLNSHVAAEVMSLLNPTLNFLVGDVARIPLVPGDRKKVGELAKEAVDLSRSDWDEHETSWDFQTSPIVASTWDGNLRTLVAANVSKQIGRRNRLFEVEDEINLIYGAAYGVAPELNRDGRVETIGMESEETTIEDLVSFAIGCMFGRYSLDEPGLILADQGSTLQDYLAKVPAPTFKPDADNVIPFVDDSRFKDDVVERFRQFLRTAFGEEHLEENLRFVEESLGVKTIRDYFIAKSNLLGRTIAKSKFYDDHVQRYKRRPIYWMFSSPKGSFNALIYLHSYTPATVSTVLNEYLREYRAKLEVALQRAEEAAAGGTSAQEQKEADRLRAVLAELRDYEHDVLYPLDIQRVEIDLDDGVKVNYPKLSPALRPIKGLEASE